MPKTRIDNRSPPIASTPIAHIAMVGENHSNQKLHRFACSEIWCRKKIPNSNTYAASVKPFGTHSTHQIDKGSSPIASTSIAPIETGWKDISNQKLHRYPCITFCQKPDIICHTIHIICTSQTYTYFTAPQHINHRFPSPHWYPKTFLYCWGFIHWWLWSIHWLLGIDSLAVAQSL